MKKSFGKLISVIYRHQNIILNSKFEKYGILSGQYNFFLIIANKDGINQREASRFLEVDKGTANRAIKKLENMGYVETRIDGDDRRLHRLYLTEKGKSILPDVRNDLFEYTSILKKGLPEDMENRVFEILELMEANVKEAVNCIREGRKHG